MSANRLEFKLDSAEFYNSDLNWLQQGLTLACHYTLQQEKVLDIYQPSITERMKKAGYEDGVGLPNPLKKKITNMANKEYWFSGKLYNHEDGYCITTELYDAKLNILLYHFSYQLA